MTIIYLCMHSIYVNKHFNKHSCTILPQRCMWLENVSKLLLLFIACHNHAGPSMLFFSIACMCTQATAQELVQLCLAQVHAEIVTNFVTRA